MKLNASVSDIGKKKKKKLSEKNGQHICIIGNIKENHSALREMIQNGRESKKK